MLHCVRRVSRKGNRRQGWQRLGTLHVINNVSNLEDTTRARDHRIIIGRELAAAECSLQNDILPDTRFPHSLMSFGFCRVGCYVYIY